jgi:hypothetical protein
VHKAACCMLHACTVINHGVLRAWILFDFAVSMNSGQFVVAGAGGMGPGGPAHATTIASLVGLPNELLHKIFTHLSNRNLLTLAAVCHRLHPLALSTYFSAHGIDPDSLLSSPTLCFTSKRMAALPGFLRMLTRPHVKSIRFVWYGSRPEYVIVREVSRVARWIKMFDDLEELDLEFKDVGFGHLVDMMDFGIPRYPLVGFGAWANALMELLGEIACSPCKRLNIHDTLFNCWPNPTPPSSHAIRRMSKNSRSRTFTGLRSLSLDCSCLFKSEDLIGWTISTLNRSSATLTTLSIVGHCISTRCLALMLPLLCLPLLSNLSISASSLQFSDLVDFLRRHTAITVLQLLNGKLLMDDSPTPSWSLPRLRMLCATAEYVYHLLRGHGRSRFPELDSISIEPKEYDKSRAQNTEKALRAVSQFHGIWGAIARKNKRLNVSITVYAETEGYPNLSTSRYAWPYSRPEIRLHRVDSRHPAQVNHTLRAVAD